MALTEANRVFGITPAWAGKSDNSENQSSKKQDHPRVGGEKALSSTALGLAIGSPPRGRGKGVLIFPRRAAVGITPAWAGKRRRAGGGTPARQDHPRVGGEKKMYRTAGACFSGSPPRGRGKVAVDHFLHSAAGITPAWAGKSRSYSRETPQGWDHPRVGGEKRPVRDAHIKAEGSPPRGRGKDIDQGEVCLQVGITPAWAGKRISRSSRRRWWRDHPRVGGEKLFGTVSGESLTGSPPRGRGKARHRPGEVVDHGITPAWAGKSHEWRLGASTTRDHPRVGGEKPWPSLAEMTRLGSPPRGRGKD